MYLIRFAELRFKERSRLRDEIGSCYLLPAT